MLNSATIIGRLTADPELRVATSGKEICRFRMAVERNGGDRVADFIPVICFGGAANFVEKYFRKGSMIAVQGRIQTGSYTDGKGVKRNTFEIVAVEVSFCEGKKIEGQPSPSPRDTSPERRGKEADTGYYSTAVPGDFDEIVGDEDYE
ncbi:MAG: single-stranded DNA-binding protein [Clostridia bacterium]|nr:single-stranded DNA-binding protein [Clostridia bacterium]